jgi:hypothetical protein
VGREFDSDNELSGARPLRLYANFFDVQLSISEVDLVFGQSFPGPDGGRAVPLVHSWLVTTPVHLVTLAAAVNAAIALYHDRYGAIPGSAPGAGSVG